MLKLYTGMFLSSTLCNILERYFHYIQLTHDRMGRAFNLISLQYGNNIRTANFVNFTNMETSGIKQGNFSST
jgi:hypothetical protein